MENKGSESSILAFILGGLIGASLGILFAPAAGKETRKKLGILLEQLDDESRELYGEFKEKASEGKRRVLKKAKKKLDKISKA
ncbi:MAG: YtxH domain-containing protein [Desulfobacterales bacterium]|nr:YtxH domain-containing protein [Desulfobacterales bacterium]